MGLIIQSRKMGFPSSILARLNFPKEKKTTTRPCTGMCSCQLSETRTRRRATHDTNTTAARAVTPGPGGDEGCCCLELRQPIEHSTARTNLALANDRLVPVQQPGDQSITPEKRKKEVFFLPFFCTTIRLSTMVTRRYHRQHDVSLER